MFARDKVMKPRVVLRDLVSVGKGVLQHLLDRWVSEARFVKCCVGGALLLRGNCGELLSLFPGVLHYVRCTRVALGC